MIWFLEGDQRLSETVKNILGNEDGDAYLSVASLWEMAIKISLGKLQLSQSLEQVIDTLPQQNITLLPIKPAYVIAVISLPF